MFILDELSCEYVLTTVLDIKYYFHLMYESDYKNIDDEMFTNVLECMNEFLSNYIFREHIIYSALNHEQKQYLKT